MERLREIAEFWNWLPAFRAVGETLHLPTAAKGLGVTPSALSRTVQQLEKALGRTLFRRSHRRLELTEDGARFLAALRDSMREVHQATVELRGDALRGSMQIGSAGVATSVWVMPAVVALHRQHPEFIADVTTDLDDVVARLLSGQLDIVFQSDRIEHPRLRTELLGRIGAGIYCRSDHPLAHRDTVSIDDVLEHEFVAGPRDEHGVPHDDWPADLPARRIALHVDQLRLGADACASTSLLAVLPEPIAARDDRLRRLPIDCVPSTRVFATTRSRLTHSTGADRLLELVHRSAAGSGKTEPGTGSS